MRVSRAAALTALALVAANALAESAWVDDRLQLGLHQAQSLSSAILELVPSGAPLEVLEHSGDMVRVRTADGTEGWVDGHYLATQPPGRARVQELERELAGAQASLADTEAKLVAAQAAASAAPGGNAQADAQAIPSDALREMQRLAEENQRLKQQVAELEAVQRMSLEQTATAGAAAAAAATPAAPASERPAPGSPAEQMRWQPWHLILLASILLLAFSAGGWLVDWGVRRRHGGYRV